MAFFFPSKVFPFGESKVHVFFLQEFMKASFSQRNTHKDMWWSWWLVNGDGYEDEDEGDDDGDGNGDKDDLLVCP